MSNLNNFTLGTVLGWLLGNIPALLSIPGKKIDDAIAKSTKSLETLEPLTIQNRKTQLRKELLSVRMIVMSLVNIIVLVLLVLSVTLGPPRLFGRFLTDANNWKLGSIDKVVLVIVIVVHTLLLSNQGASSWSAGVKQWIKVSRWLKDHQS